MNVLKILGARPRPHDRIVRSGRIVTAAGVSAGIDLALWLASEIAGRELAEAIQPTIEYDPQPPFHAGHMSKAARETRERAREIMDERMPSDQRRLVPKIAWRRFVDLIRTGRSSARARPDLLLPLMRSLAAFVLAAATAASPAPSPTPALRQPVPAKTDPAARYLIYLHGRIIEEKGIHPTDPRYGPYDYVGIVRALERKGFTVVTEARPKGTDPARYAETVKAQVEALIAAGVPARRVTVLGASKGAVIAMLASTAIRNRDVNFVLMSSCNDWVRENFRIDLHGNVLSIYDRNDEFGSTCGPIFAASTGLSGRKEVVLQLGTGHAVLYQPLPEWIDPVDSWAREAADHS